ncbi:Osmotically-inducible protein Y precursor [Anaerohalosphaera lusitana]|uniref:Osmotically-inducible protein Y n=1 Tax=Anaerohalosphaera lusitana TaxID=1936003 RepID=A0A1U9NQT1_9BACT|nr:BON domain-containing protein [Anaerohalosphaera lusitana]AQT70137.1 Osmotically-inducible protein Y precursor [Anaerohalosphaera lusitana]
MNLKNRNLFSAYGFLVSVLIISFLGSVSCGAVIKSDSDINDAIMRQMEKDDVVSPHLVDIRVNEGIVTLDGSVDNLIAKERALNIAGSILGVVEVRDELVVRPIEIPDQAIRQNVKQALEDNPVTELMALDVKVENGVVSVGGEVKSITEKRIAEKIAESIAGVRSVRNEIEVSVKIDRPDSELAAEIRQNMKYDPYLNAQSIDVAVKDGVAVLSGETGSVFQMGRARRNAFILGVKRVDSSDLIVKPWKEYPTEMQDSTAVNVEAAVASALSSDVRVNRENIRIDIRGHKATLRGTVASLYEKNAAEDDASNVTGVWQVSNKLKVRPQEVPSDDAIAGKIRVALKRHTVTEPHEITVTVRNQKVYLYGNVQNITEKNMAENIASQIKGVAAIDNRISVVDAEDAEYLWKSDQQIKEDIRDELFWTVFVEAEDVNVMVQDGTAILTGTVNDWQEVLAAIENAYEGGAEKVKSDLDVRNNEDEQLPPASRDMHPYYYFGYF